MSESTRRRFLLTAGAGAAVAAAATAGIAGRKDEAGASGAAAGASARLPKTDGPLVAYVSDARTGKITVMAGESEVEVTDHDLVARLASARNKG